MVTPTARGVDQSTSNSGDQQGVGDLELDSVVDSLFALGKHGIELGSLRDGTGEAVEDEACLVDSQRVTNIECKGERMEIEMRGIEELVTRWDTLSVRVRCGMESRRNQMRAEERRMDCRCRLENDEYWLEHLLFPHQRCHFHHTQASEISFQNPIESTCQD